ncbi:MAG: SAM-dependent methyltransferase [Sulfurimonas sp.]|nr:MAG: SAM-dependent methyltransferase [Sulfurimonas sp.]
MNILQLEQKLQNLTDNLVKDDFIFDFLSAYEMPKSNISRLRKNSDVNTLELNGELTVKNKKLFFKSVESQNLNAIYEELVTSKKTMRFVLVTDFKTLMAFDSKLLITLKIPLEELSKNSDFFWGIAGVEKATVYDEKEADVKASLKMAKLFDEIKKTNTIETQEDIHALNVFLTRLLFCYYAEDTQIFEGENTFTTYISSTTNADGSDVDIHIAKLFEVLNSKNRDISHHLKNFPYVNGGLFAQKLNIPKLTYKSRKLLIECGGELNWSQINPDIFGSMIQAVISDEHRGGNGMHYTSVPNIMKVINPLFLEELQAEFEKAKTNPKKLNELHKRITNIKIFDPACGSGNFLIIAYKELRRLEMKIFKSAGMLNMPSIKLSQFYGIELDDFAHEVAILSLWLTEHQMNMEFKKEFGDCTPTLPLKDGGNIIQGNATRLEWNEVCPKEDGDEIYVLGNPPYIGTRNQVKEHKEDMEYLFKGVKNYKTLDYIACWFYLGAKYIKGINSRYAFVSTNSITQGDQVATLWSNVFNEDVEINFAYQSFKWSNNAKNNAGVIVVIVGIANKNKFKKKLYKNGIVFETNIINGYLLDAPNIYIERRSSPILNIPKMSYGNYTGGCNELLLTPLEKENILAENEDASKFIRKLSGSAEFIQGKERYCLWISNEDLEEASQIQNISDRINKVKENRLKSKDESLQKLALRAHQFRDLNEAKVSSIIVPIVSSERRKYIPIGFLEKDVIIPNSAQVIYDADVWIFGFITSYIHNIWVKTVGGKLKSDYRYSSVLCYNTFPFPKITQIQKVKIEELVHLILDERDKNFPKTMAELYDPNKMPKGLKQAHHNLDLYIEKCYREKPFQNDEERLEYLFRLYEKMVKEEKKL